MCAFRPAALYPIVDVTGAAGAAAALDLAEKLLAAGAPWLQLRVKRTPAADHLAIARALVERAGHHDASIIVNDRLDVALASGAAGVHLGQEDLPLEAARRLAAPGRLLVGISTHSVEQAVAAEAGSADYIGFGPIFATATKQDALAPRRDGALAAVRAAVALPIVAIGGITPETARGVLAAGADAVAMIGALARAPDPGVLAARILTLAGPSDQRS